ncbi:MAG: polysaccharide biosynthesis protein [Bacteroidales bacterium]|nr:polysaccharide biosynthesis protein [Bacteroidales bacterium]
MLKNLIQKLHAPKWVVFFIDVCIVCISIFISYLLRFNFSISESINQGLAFAFAIILPIRILAFLISKTYAGLVRYTSTNDAIRICATVFLSSVLIFSVDFAFKQTIPISIVILECILSIAFLTLSRFVVKALYFEYKNTETSRQNVLILGANEFALTTKRTLDRDAGTNYNVVAFVDQNNLSIGKNIDGVSIFGIEKLEELIDSKKVTTLIFAEQVDNKKSKQEIIDCCLNKNVKILSTPNVSKWTNGELSFKQIKNIKIEDLLERDPIKLDELEIRKDIVNKVVMVTGAAGSIGSEIVRQLTKFNPKTIVIFDQAESPLYDLELELREKYKFDNFEIVIGSVTDKVRLTATFEAFHPTIIYHAAAYKHVPMMENNPSQAIQNNVYGTKLLADFSVKYNVAKFVMVSTDKAVNPTNVMGCSKRICEIYTQSLNKRFNTKFITTRFGNVLGSNGSVIPRFKAQIEKGGPVTVTDPKITRFFMTIPEACQLVLQAGTLGNGGEIFIFDMGKSVKIIDLAKKMIKLSGLTLGKDIAITYTGLRPGEKLYEEVLNDKEKTIPTSHSQIMVARVREYDFAQVSSQISELIDLVKTCDNFRIVAKMKQIVPEFKSENSIYEELDTLTDTVENQAEISKDKIVDNNNSTKNNSNQIVFGLKNSVSIGKKFSLVR